MKTARQVLIDAKTWLSGRGHRYQGGYVGHDKPDGTPANTCAIGAVVFAITERSGYPGDIFIPDEKQLYSDCVFAMKDCLPSDCDSIPAFNDNPLTNKTAILKLFDCAIEKEPA